MRITQWNLQRGGMGSPGRGSGLRAIAAVEFALIAPILLLVLIGGADIGCKVWARSVLVNAVAQGAYYAFLAGPTVSASTVVSFVENAAQISGVTATVSGPTVYCTSTDPASLTAAPKSGNCADGSSPGTYLLITATANAFALDGGTWDYGGPQVGDQTMVRLQ